MSRRPRHVLAPNLFPFLAVLVCTMGTLILLLALVAQKAEESAEQIAQSQTKAAKLQTEEERWRAEELQQLRARQTAELEKRRSELAHLEDHLRRLRQEMAELADEAAAADRPSDASSEQAEARLVSLRARINEEKERLAKLQEERDGRPPRVVIVPYKGTNGTDRRPIYVECTDQAVIIQPEGVRITAAHLEGPLGPGNPLDAALRAVRDHWQQTDPESPPPYPLLLVRPGGIHAYAACRVAMTAWDDQFGYELISDDLRLGFPEADAELHAKLVQTIREASRRQQARIASMPGRYPSLSREAVAASEIGRGPSDSEIGRGASDSEYRGGRPASGSSRRDSVGNAGPGGSGPSYAGPGLTGSGDTGLGDAGLGDTGHGVPGLGVPGPESLSRESLAAGSMRSTTPSPAGQASSARGEMADAQVGPESLNRQALGRESLAAGSVASPAENDPPLAASELAPSAQAGRRDAGAGPEGSVAADLSNPLAGTGGTESRGQIRPPQAGGGSGSSAGPPPSGVNVSAGGSASPSVASPMPPPPSDPHAKMFSEAAESPSFQADRRGSSSDNPPELHAGNDWALPASMSGRRGTSIVRQIRLRCEPDRFVLLPGSRDNGAMTVITVRSGDVQQAVMELAKVLRDRVESWGLAMQNGRWDPVLVVTVTADAEARFEQLQALLRGSGIRVEREKSP